MVTLLTVSTVSSLLMSEYTVETVSNYFFFFFATLVLAIEEKCRLTVYAVCYEHRLHRGFAQIGKATTGQLWTNDNSY